MSNSTRETDNRGDFIGNPQITNAVGDYTKTRTGALGYTIDDLIGRKDTNKYKLVTDDPATVSGTSGSILI